MNPTWTASFAITLLSLTGAAYAQSAADSATAGNSSTERVENGVPISQLIAAVAKRTGKKFVVDPRVHGNVTLVGQDAANVNLSDLMTILSVYSYVTTESGGYVVVLPDANARQVSSPRLSGKETFPDAEVVNATITVKNVPAAQLVPLLRPLIPQYGHLAALPCVNKLMIVDRYANVRRIQAVIESVDVGSPYTPEKCESLSGMPKESNVEHR
jgi:general secretion pathway protein D